MDQLDLTQRYEVPGFSLAWDVFGDAAGPPLVLAHGYTGASHDFAAHVDALAATRRVFIIDHRGHGQSTNSGDPSTYTVDHIVDDLIAWTSDVVAADGTPFDLLGHSMGGRIAIRYALARRDLVRSLILMDTTAWAFGPVSDDFRAQAVAFVSAIPLDGPLPDLPRTPEDELIATTATPQWQRRKAEVRAMVDPAAARALGLALFNDELTRVDHQLGDIDCPTTVIAGAFDAPYADHAPRLAAAVADGVHVIIDDAFHSPQLTHGEQWRAAVEAHLARADRAS